MDFLINNEHPNVVLHFPIAGLLLYTPRKTIRAKVRREAEKHLRKKYLPGQYTEKDANSIVQHMFTFYESRINRLIKKISKADLVYFILFQYDNAAKVHSKFQKGLLTNDEHKYWQANGPMYRRTIGYLLDKIVANFTSPFKNDTPPVEAYCTIDECFICCENANKYSLISNEIHYLNDSYEIIIHPPNSEYFITTRETEKSRAYSINHNYYVEQSTRDISLRTIYIDGIPYERDWIEHGNILNQSFLQAFGLTYHETMFTLSDIIVNTREIKKVEDIPLVDKRKFINEIATHFNADNQKIEFLFEGLILRKAQLKQHTRTIWKYKQPYRINKRPFIELLKGNTLYLTWSNEMLKERLDKLDNDFVFKTIPLEWNNNKILKATDLLSNKVGLWFEGQVKLNLNKLGIIGDKIKDKIIKSSVACDAKPIGGFDFFGYCPNSNMIIIIECKYMDSGFEPRSYFDDLMSFKEPRRGYIVKLDRKVNWALSNLDKIKKELTIRLDYKIPENCNKIGAAFFTYVMTFAFAFIENYPCISFTDFLYNYEKEKIWYFEKGIFEKKLPSA